MKSRHDYSTLLLWSALLVTVTRYVGAFIASDVGQLTGWVSEMLTVLMAISGVGMGILDVLGVAYVFDGWRRALPGAGKSWPFRFRILSIFVLLMFVCGTSILVPFTVSRILHRSLAEVLGEGALWAWAIAVNVSPYLLVGGIVTGQSGIVTVTPVTNAVAKTDKETDTVLPDDKKSQYLADSRGRNGKGPMTIDEIVKKYGVSQRTAYRWTKSTN